MPTRRESPHPHMIRRNPILRRMSPHHPHRPLSILHLHRMVILRPQPILQHKRRHPSSIQPLRNRVPLLLHRQMLIPTPRSHHHSGLRRIHPRRQKHRQRRLILIRIPQSPRSTRRPQQNHRLPRRRRRRPNNLLPTHHTHTQHRSSPDHKQPTSSSSNPPWPY